MRRILLIALIGILLIASLAAFGQNPVNGRTFTYQSVNMGLIWQEVNWPGLHQNQVIFETNVVIAPYLYIYGELSCEFDVVGWGAAPGISAVETWQCWHNEPITLSFPNQGWLDPTKVANTGNAGGKQTVDASLAVSWGPWSGGTVYSSGAPVRYPNLGTLHPLAIDPAASGGHAAIEFTRSLNITADNGPGQYRTQGTLYITRG
jgi:hypothetical protein